MYLQSEREWRVPPSTESQSAYPSTREAEEHRVSVESSPWGVARDGQRVQLFQLANSSLRVEITTFGARLVRLQAPDRDERQADILLGYKSLEEYEADDKTYLGATIGRYANRLAHGKFSLDGEDFQVPQNNGVNALHGGSGGFDRKVWEACVVEGGVEMTLRSDDGDMGFPGALDAHVRYTLKDAALVIDYTAVTTRPTVLNLTNHAYFNLAGEGSGTVLDQVIRIAAENYTPVSETLIPTGEIASVHGTPFDLRQPVTIGASLMKSHPQIKRARGYDHNFVLEAATDKAMRLAAEARDPNSGRVLRVETTEPGVQFYSGNFLDGSFIGKSGVPYTQHAGFCLETQHFPDSPNQPSFPSTVLRPGETFRSTTVYRFGIAGESAGSNTAP